MLLISLIKITVSISLVLGLVYVSERFSPRVAGIIGGTIIGGTFISLFFFGFEHGPDFVQQAIPWVIAGLGAEIAFYIGYYMGSQLFDPKASNFYHMSSSTIFGFLFFIAAGYILSTLNLTLLGAVCIFLLSYVIGNFVLKRIKDAKIKNVKAVKTKELAFRAIMVSVLILAITNVPQFLGNRWAGIFSAFATCTFPTLLILQYKYRDEAFPTVLKNISWSLSSLVVYVISIFYLYVSFGIYWGTLLGTVISFVYLFFILFLSKSFKKLTLSNHARLPKMSKSL